MRADGPDFKTLLVAGVADGSPAAEAGLRDEDQILKIDGKATGRLTMDAVIKMLDEPKAYLLLIKRGSEHLELTLTPRKCE